ncbi:MAG: mannose-6-phosphate isomerase, class I [Spirochaetaceae bacterium]|jgi:mannose-6-phosphate isomerase|nr:mannose-6-phosphate isomerase, class I [Spirochaetaceae bacterium]
MNAIYLLKNEIKHYDWGSTAWIPELLDQSNEKGEPYAELWMGVHPSGMSLADGRDSTIALKTLIESNKQFFLGRQVKNKFNGLPYLFKLLAAEKPLSIQAHPNLEQAKRGFERENERAMTLDNPSRNYKDANHKPEIICALSPFRAMCGFRTIPDIISLLKKFNCPVVLPLIKIFDTDKNTNAQSESSAGRSIGDSENLYKRFLTKLFSLSLDDRNKISDYIKNHSIALKEQAPEFNREWDMLVLFNRYYDSDPAVLSPLYLNVLDLKPGESVFLPAGVLHAYISGFGVELMANSDNVLRGGLTHKYIDSTELLSILNLEPFLPRIFKPNNDSYFEYPTEASEFSLVCMKSDERSIEKKCDIAGPTIIIVVEGELVIRFKNGEDPLKVKKGRSIFIAAELNRDDFSLTGSYTFYAAHCVCPQNEG